MNRADQSPDSLLKALTDVRIPTENHNFIRRIVRTIGIAEFRRHGHAVCQRSIHTEITERVPTPLVGIGTD